MRGRYPIHEANMAKFEAEMARLVKKAEKLGCPPVSYRVVGEEHRKVTSEHGPTLYERYLLVEIEGEAPQLKGWRFVATLQHEPGGNIVRALPGEQVPAEYRTAPKKCDHCGLQRIRKDTYIVRNEEGEYRQVGKTCLRDFLGGHDPHALARYMEELHGFFADCENWGGPGEPMWWNTREYLGLVLAVIRQEGWLSKARAEETGRTPTSEEAANLYWNTMRREERRRALESLSDQDWELIDRALAWVRELKPATDYQHNLKVACSEDVMNPRNAGLVASLLVAYRPELARREGGRHVGEVGQKIELEATVMQVLTIQGMYGVSHLHVFEDREGNELVWFASSTVLEPGVIYRLTGTVKRHETYKGRPRTVLTRCKAEIIGVLDEQGNERVLATA